MRVGDRLRVLGLGVLWGGLALATSPVDGPVVYVEASRLSTQQRAHYRFGELLQRALQKNGKDLSPSEFHTAIEGWLTAWQRGTYDESNAASLTAEQLRQAGRPDFKRLAMFQLRQVWPRDADGYYLPERAPLELLAVVNRFDIDETRFIFSFQNHGVHKPLTIIFEYHNPIRYGTVGNCAKELEVKKYWGCRWYRLNPASKNFETELGDILDTVTSRQMARTETLVAGQIRTSDLMSLTNGWSFREWKVTGDRISLNSTANTPALGELSEPSSKIKEFVLTNLEAIARGDLRDGKLNLPRELTAAESLGQFQSPRFNVDFRRQIKERLRDRRGRETNLEPAVDEVQLGFQSGTCMGCHHTSSLGATQTFFHVAPDGEVSSFMKTELRKRQVALRELMRSLAR